VVLIGGIPAHPLLVHAVVVLLPLAAVGAVVVASRPVWRRRFGVAVLLIAVVGVATVPFTVVAGEQLRAALPGSNPLIDEHARRAALLLPVAAGFLVLLAAAVVVGRSADSARSTHGSGGVVLTANRSGRKRRSSAARRGRLAAALAVLAALAGVAVTGLVVWIGHAGSLAVWQGVAQ
jgi:hypothetical protein